MKEGRSGGWKGELYLPPVLGEGGSEPLLEEGGGGVSTSMEVLVL
jgi:hypothetical protein